MAHFNLTPKWLAMVRAARVATARGPTPPQQTESESKANDAEKEHNPIQHTNEHPEDIPSHSAKTVTPADATGEYESTMHSASIKRDGPARASKIIKVVRKHVNDKAKFLATQTKDAVTEAVKNVKHLGFIGTAKAIGDWVKLHPWETALIVTPLVALIITAIVLSATGFGPAGIVAGSTAAIIHAGIGNVVAGSVFATCTSAMMGGYGALIVFGGVWISTTVFMVGLAAAWKNWKCQSQRAMVLSKNSSPKTAAEHAKQAVSDTMFWLMLAGAYVVYRAKSWYRGHGEGGSPAHKAKSE